VGGRFGGVFQTDGPFLLNPSPVVEFEVDVGGGDGTVWVRTGQFGPVANHLDIRYGDDFVLVGAGWEILDGWIVWVVESLLAAGELACDEDPCRILNGALRDLPMSLMGSVS